MSLDARPGSAEGVPASPVAPRHSPTLKLGAAPDPSGARADPRSGEPTVPVRRDAQDVPPDATISGAAFIGRRNADLEAAPTGEGTRAPPDAAPPSRDGDPIGWLVIAAPAAAPPGAIWPIGDGATIVGSRAAPDRIRIDHADLAPEHGVLFHQAGRTWYLDLCSPAGSAINGRRLPPMAGQELRDRDVLHLGGLELQFRSLGNPPDVPVR